MSFLALNYCLLTDHFLHCYLLQVAPIGGYKRKKKPLSPVKPNRPAKRKQWTEEAMIGAIRAVQDNGSSANQAAKTFGVPPSTLKDRISGRVLHGTKPGPAPYLSREEEDKLESYVVESCNLGYGKTRRQIKGIVEKVAIEKHKKGSRRKQKEKE